MTALQYLPAAMAILVACAAPASASAATAAPRANPAVPAAAEGARVRTMPFTHLGLRPVTALRGPAASVSFEFGSRADELVTRATLRIRYAFSPAFDPSSHIRVRVNDQVAGLLPFAADEAGRTRTRELAVDPQAIVGANRVVLDVVGLRGGAQEDPARPGLWAEVSGSSEVELVTRPIDLADDLSRLPEPFFDRRDQRRLVLPFAFAAQPSHQSLRAAAIVASWFGQMAAWRGARFPVSLDKAPAGHAVVFATDAERPAFLRDLAPAKGPELRLLSHPGDPRAKLLVVMGRDGDELRTAALGLVLGKSALAGAMAAVREVQEPPPRGEDDAPAWVRIDRPTRLGELIDWPQQLESAGGVPDLQPIQVDFRMPPDLAAWRGPGVPMRLRFRYTPPPCTRDARLEVRVSDEALTVLNLRTGTGRAADAARASLPEAITDAAEIAIPSFRLRSRGQLQFAFHFVPESEGDCRAGGVRTAKASIDADSTIDFSGFPRFVEMPQLGHFVAAGFPFTGRADLARTVVVLPAPPGPADLEAFLAVMGRMGESTGVAATRVRIAGPGEDAMLADADLLLVGASSALPLLGRWSERMPVTLAGKVRRLRGPSREWPAFAQWLGLSAADDARAVSEVKLEADGPLAALVGFESPVTAGRSVVALTARAPEDLALLLEAMDDPETRPRMRGSAVFVQPGRLESVTVGPVYGVGFLPPWAGLGYRLAAQPVLAAALATVVAFLVLYLAWRVRVAVGRRRKRGAP